MPTYTILGATGSTGSSLTRLLLPSTSTHLNLYARSPTKLHAMHPTLSEHASHVSISTGALSDAGIITSAIRGADVVFAVLAQNESDPEVRIARDAAEAIIGAIHSLKGEAEQKGREFICPTVVFLSSSTMSPTLAVSGPVWLVKQAFWYIYNDLSLAFDLFALPENAFIPFIQACPPGLVNAPSVGARISLLPGGPAMCAYDDLAKGMVEIAEGREGLIGEQVAVFGLGEAGVSGVELVRWFVPGILCSWLPPVWRLGKMGGLW